MHIIVDLGAGQLAGKERHGPLGPISRGLRENCANGDPARIGFDTNWQGAVKEHQGNSRHESLLELHEGRVGGGGELEATRAPGEVSEWGGDGGVTRDKAPVKIAEPEKRLDGAERGGRGPVLDGCDPIGVHGDARTGDAKAHKGHLGFLERALGHVHVQLVFAESLKYFSYVLKVLVQRRRKNQNVVQIDDHRALD